MLDINYTNQETLMTYSHLALLFHELHDMQQRLYVDDLAQKQTQSATGVLAVWLRNRESKLLHRRQQ